MRTNTQEALLSAYIASIGKRTPREAAQNTAELCRPANSEGAPGSVSRTWVLGASWVSPGQRVRTGFSSSQTVNQ